MSTPADVPSSYPDAAVGAAVVDLGVDGEGGGGEGLDLLAGESEEFPPSNVLFRWLLFFLPARIVTMR